jgi:hypothetical protein
MCPPPPTGRHIVPTHPLEPSGGGGATAHSSLSRTRLYYAHIDMAILQNVFHRISCARINRRNRRNRPCMETSQQSTLLRRSAAWCGRTLTAAAPAAPPQHDDDGHDGRRAPGVVDPSSNRRAGQWARSDACPRLEQVRPQAVAGCHCDCAQPMLIAAVCAWRCCCSWNHFGCGVSEALIHAQTEAFAKYLAPAGYEYMNLGAAPIPFDPVCSSSADGYHLWRSVVAQTTAGWHRIARTGSRRATPSNSRVA